MSRPEYLTEDLYDLMQKEAKRYRRDYEAIQERNKKLEETQQQRMMQEEESYSLLMSFETM